MLDPIHRDEIRSRFHLKYGQFYAVNVVKNVYWFLNGNKFGFGDLRRTDIDRIYHELEPGEVFEAFHEGHKTEWMQRESPMVRITVGEIVFPGFEPVSEKSRKEYM